MPRRLQHHDEENTQRWVVSYADLMTLMFAFFVVMYALSSVNEEKYKDLAASLSGAFVQVNNETAAPASDVIIGTDKTAGESVVDLHGETLEKPNDSSPARLSLIHERLVERVIPYATDAELSFNEQALWVSITLPSEALFSAASAEVTPLGKQVLERIGLVLRPYENPIHVEGFTDDIPIATRQFPSNWELSAARAAATVRLLEQAGVDPSQMAAVGYAAYQPAFSNRTEEGKRLNRRVVIVISRDKKVRRVLTSFGSNQVSSDAVSAIIEADEKELLDQNAIEQLTTPSGGVIFKQSDLPE